LSVTSYSSFKFLWGQWDLNIAGKWVQPLENDFLLLGTIQNQIVQKYFMQRAMRGYGRTR